MHSPVLLSNAHTSMRGDLTAIAQAAARVGFTLGWAATIVLAGRHEYGAVKNMSQWFSTTPIVYRVDVSMTT
ncbi:hypothetical protein M3I54_24135 [Paraburkholderia sp. CNPSo 3274]|uniref:hypothetical protein n=1 Tax=Paraburkholderia sp. CNPSo 3274 TaxID=2940932 RepID=UPI0020B84A89|nr:hypothetical protein [Paraburkholderia sp. CNPSo 3274]MCP3710033.1 hypothetical protein [Paraburkholderia sp. CNPSo 3274]